MKRKKGVVMLEVLILLNILIVLIVYNSKTILANLNKYDLYEIKEDIFYLNDLEYNLLNEVEDLIKNDEEIFVLINSYKDDLSINYEYSFSKNEKLKFLICEGKLYIKEIFPGKTETIREIDVVFIEDHMENVEIIFKPKLYKMSYII